MLFKSPDDPATRGQWVKHMTGEQNPQQGGKPLRKVDEHTLVVRVTDADFAAALASVGVPFMDPPVMVREDAQGIRHATWNFEPYDPERELDVQKLVGAQRDPLKFCMDHPQHVLTYALAAILNAKLFARVMAERRAFISFDLGNGQIMHVMEGSRKARRLTARGFKRI